MGRRKRSEWGILNTDAGRRKYPTVPGNYLGYYDAVYGALRDGGSAPVSREGDAYRYPDARSRIRKPQKRLYGQNLTDIPRAPPQEFCTTLDMQITIHRPYARWK